MIPFLRHLLTMTTVVAVFIVSTTCTSIGCLLPAVMGKTTKPQMACCLSHTKRSAPSQSDPNDGKPKHCPTCDQAVSFGTIEKVTPTLNIDFAPCFVASAVLAHASLVPFSNSPDVSATPSIGPPTLLDLHCSLLT